MRTERERQIIEGAERLARAVKGCDESIRLHPYTREKDTEEGRAHWSRASAERDAAIASLVAVVSCAEPDVIECKECKGLGKVPMAHRGDSDCG